MSRGTNEEEVAKYRDEGLPKIEAWVVERTKNGAHFLSGTDHPDIVDIFLFPLLERVVLFEDTVWDDIFKKVNFKETAPTTYAYVHKAREYELFKPHVISTSIYAKYLIQVRELAPGVYNPL